MNTLEKLIQIADAENIIIDYTEYLPNNLQGLYMNLDNIGPIICILHKAKENKNEYIRVLSKELGNYFISAGNNLISTQNYKDYIKICECENQELHLNTNKAITTYDLEMAFKNNCASYYEIAEYLNVPERLIREKIKYWANKHLNGYIELGEYKVILTNLPNIMIYKEI